MNWKKLGKRILIFFLAGMLAAGVTTFVVTIIAVTVFGVYGLYLNPVYSLLNMIFSIGVGAIAAWYFTKK